MASGLSLKAWALCLLQRLMVSAPSSPSTVNSKAEVRFHLASADWIAEPVRQKIALKVPTPFCLAIPGWDRLMGLCGVPHFPPWQHKNKINKAGELILTSEISRYQFRNLAECLQKIRDMIAEASQMPKEPSKEDAQLQRLRYRWAGERRRGAGGRNRVQELPAWQWGSLQRGARCQPRPSCTSGSCSLGCSACAQLPALKSTDCTPGPHCRPLFSG